MSVILLSHSQLHLSPFARIRPPGFGARYKSFIRHPTRFGVATLRCGFSGDGIHNHDLVGSHNITLVFQSRRSVSGGLQRRLIDSKVEARSAADKACSKVSDILSLRLRRFSFTTKVTHLLWQPAAPQSFSSARCSVGSSKSEWQDSDARVLPFGGERIAGPVIA